MAVAVDTRGAVASGSGVSVSQSYTIGASLANGALIVLFTLASGTAISGLVVKWGTQTMTQIVTQNINSVQTFLHGLVAPAGGTQTLSITWTAPSAAWVADIVSFSGVAQTGGFPHSTSNAASAAGSTITVTSAVGNWTVAVVSKSSGNNISSVSDNQIFLSTLNGGNDATGAATVTLTSTWTGSVAYNVVGTDVRAAPATLVASYDSSEMARQSVRMVGY